MTKKDFDLYDHHQGVMKKLMTKDFRDYVGREGKAEMTETSGHFTVSIEVSSSKKDDLDRI